MALNRFSSLPKATIRNTQVLTDLGIIDTALQRKQKVYDTKAATIGAAVQGAESLPVFGEADTAYKNQVLGDIKAKVGEISNQDLADPNVTKGVDQFLQQAGNDPRLKQAVQAKSMYDNYQKGREELAAKGKLNPSQEYFMNKAWQHYSDKGELLPNATQPLVESVDGFTERSKYFKDLRASGGDAIKYLKDGTAFKNSGKGIDSNRTLKQANGIWQDYTMSQIGRQDSLDYDMLIDSKQLDPKKTSRESYMRDMLLGTGKTYEYYESSTNRDSAENQARDRAERKTKEEAIIPAETHGFDYTNGTKYRFDEDGDFVAKDMQASLLGTAWDALIKPNKAGEEELDDNQKNIIAIAKKNNTSPAKVVEAQSQYRTVPFDMYAGGQGEKLSKVLPAISTSQKITIGGETTTLANYLEKHRGIDVSGLDAKKRKELFSELQVIGEVKPNGGLTTGYVIGDSKGQVILDVTDQVIADALGKDGTAQAKAITTLDSQADEQLKRGQSAQTIINGKPIIIYPNLQNPGFHEGGFFTH